MIAEEGGLARCGGCRRFPRPGARSGARSPRAPSSGSSRRAAIGFVAPGGRADQGGLVAQVVEHLGQERVAQPA